MWPGGPSTLQTWQNFKNGFQSVYHTVKGKISQKIGYSDLKPSEKEFLKNNTFASIVAYGNKSDAERLEDLLKTPIMQGPAGDDGGVQNAVKHAYFSALNTSDLGYEQAKIIGDNHEEGEVSELSKMDRANNNVGYEIGLNGNPKSNSVILTDILKAGMAGKLTIVVDIDRNRSTRKINLSDKQYTQHVQIIQNAINTLKEQENEAKNRSYMH